MRQPIIGGLLMLAAAGCAILAKPEAVVACQAADAATTAIGVQRGHSEQNPVMAKAIDAGGVPALFVLKAFYAWAVLRWFPGDSERERAVRAAAAGIGCLAAAHNAAILAR